MRLLPLIPLFPLAGAVVLLFAGRRLRGDASGRLASLVVAVSFVLSVALLITLVSKPSSGRVVLSNVWDWITVGAFHVNVAFRADPLSIVMAMTVTGVGTLIHVYSIDYMRGDPGFARFFAYMNLFVFFMLTLVLANNFLLLYLGWEGVGLCSYLLIGFWFERKAAADAAKKAFITTRIGDSAFLIGIVFIWFKFHSLDFGTVFAHAPGLANGTATIMALLLFAGAVGKSAQLPLHVWLPDAMEGPTPVSALIHAATMVTAGVYLVVRTHPIFEQSGTALTIVAVVGIVTAIYAGFSAVAQDDIKRMLAYSTISQLGFMFFGAGMGAYSAAIFLLVAHAFFKALLFLGAGSVMHALPNDETDMTKMGGLRKAMPITAATWVVAWLAMVGIPPLSGFFAKDQVVAAARQSGRIGLWYAALFGALLTAIYESRGTFMTFFGQPRYEGHPHDPPPRMRSALVVLAVGAAVAGFLGLSATTGLLPKFLAPVVGRAREVTAGPSELVLSVISVAIALAGIGIAYVVYLSGRIDWLALRMRLGALKRTLMSGFYVNDFYSNVIVGPAKLGAAFLAVFDRRVIDGAVTGVGTAFGALARTGRKVQTGLVRNYALGVLLGAVGVLWYLAVRF
ncbi:MAG TPA: NADH-quinone oxidoreductase subunit L [Candidatus Dormibacteraeota bacterium]|nr:NADH-quinone oxidoreductase subunit L [Candidatus Dormibacteraeota bacterium]